MAVDTRQGLEQALADVNDQIRRIEKQISSTENSANFTAAEKAPRLTELRAELAVYRTQQTNLIQQLNQLGLLAQRNTSSSADTTHSAQVARDDNASPAAPQPPIPLETGPDGRIIPKTTNSDSNANKTPTTETGAVDRGTNAPVVTLANSQSISSPQSTGALKDTPVRGAYLPSGQPLGVVQPVNNGAAGGIGAGNDDRSQKPTSVTQNLLDNLYASNKITAEANVLDQYPSYTYNLSWYLLSPSNYANILSGTSRGLPGRYLLAQSGGAPVQNASPTQSGTVGVGRNPNFPLDYYIDDFFVDYLYSGTPGSRGASAISELGFTVTEPNGITLLSNLYSAITDLYKAEGVTADSTAVNYASAQFCMVVRFYGYDANGNLMLPVTGSQKNSIDSYAVVEKIIPFLITSIDFKVANKLVEYTIKAVSPGQATGLSTSRASMPNNFQFQGATVSEMLVGGVQQQPVPVSSEGRAVDNRGTRGGV